MNTVRKALIAGGLVATTLTGGALGASLLGTAGAQESTTTTVAGSTDAPPARHMDDGKTEVTGEDAEKATAAALEAVPDGTVKRVVTDAEGDSYDVHMSKADGSCVTVKLDENFKVVGVEEGPAGGRHGGPRPGAPAPEAPTDTAS
jgi:hypothetical protein